jgi:hypothetical protein
MGNMRIEGIVKKMKLSPTKPVGYEWVTDQGRIQLNSLLGKKIRLKFEGEIFCIHCNRKTKNSFQQGHCYPCSIKLASCDICMVRPEKCHFEKGTCREPEWGLKECFQNHYVYLANSSGIKVGITREHQIPTRWLDQGAIQALPIVKVKNRLHSGLIETRLSGFIADKTQWQRLLKQEAEKVDFTIQRDLVLKSLSDFKEFEFDILPMEEKEFQYPVLSYPEKIKSLNFDKLNLIEGVLTGLKGQYLILDTGVLNVRQAQGYKIIFEEIT